MTASVGPEPKMSPAFMTGPATGPLLPNEGKPMERAIQDMVKSAVASFAQDMTLAKLFDALSKAQGKIKAAVHDRENPHFKSKYATLAAVWDACRAPLSEHGLAVIQVVRQNQRGGSDLITILAHSSGQSIESVIAVTGATPQAFGSALTYARRQALQAITGVASAEEDDDGNNASQGRQEKQGGGAKGQVRNEKLLEPWKPTEGQVKRLYTLASKAKLDHDQVHSVLKQRMKVASASDIPSKEAYDWICGVISKRIQAAMPVVEKDPEPEPQMDDDSSFSENLEHPIQGIDF